MPVLVLLALCIALTDTLTAFPPKFLVGNLNEDVVVKCNTSRQEVKWTQNGEPEPMAELVENGRNLTILGLDLPATGNYSCWAGGVLLDSTYVVVGDSGEGGRAASCRADSYLGSFRCSWKGPRSAVFRARLTRRWVSQPPAPAPPAPRAHSAFPHSDGSVGLWVPAAGHGGRFSANFTDPSFCPFAEELRPLQLSFEGISDTSFLSFSIHFFVRDIVRPDAPQALTAHLHEGQLHLAWAPPASWPLPRSYFALLYWLQYELPNGTQVDTFVEGTEQTRLRERVRRVRISCQDPYSNSSWSPWSGWREVGTAGLRRG
ncbi:interleukin-12 subunit beta-like [Coturnix japonica]|uniref:interleukin-12 subunit beta-like n=1 Tax=Coturnix japonica TaxID=93934 RepID=UPI000777C4EF|nr:interleukin-12 subunit beta-like [Coturnix japonica]